MCWMWENEHLLDMGDNMLKLVVSGYLIVFGPYQTLNLLAICSTWSQWNSMDRNKWNPDRIGYLQIMQDSMKDPGVLIAVGTMNGVSVHDRVSGVMEEWRDYVLGYDRWIGRLSVIPHRQVESQVKCHHRCWQCVSPLIGSVRADIGWLM